MLVLLWVYRLGLVSAALWACASADRWGALLVCGWEKMLAHRWWAAAWWGARSECATAEGWGPRSECATAEGWGPPLVMGSECQLENGWASGWEHVLECRLAGGWEHVLAGGLAMGWAHIACAWCMSTLSSAPRPSPTPMRGEQGNIHRSQNGTPLPRNQPSRHTWLRPQTLGCRTGCTG